MCCSILNNSAIELQNESNRKKEKFIAGEESVGCFSTNGILSCRFFLWAEELNIEFEYHFNWLMNCLFVLFRNHVKWFAQVQMVIIGLFLTCWFLKRRFTCGCPQQCHQQAWTPASLKMKDFWREQARKERLSWGCVDRGVTTLFLGKFQTYCAVV